MNVDGLDFRYTKKCRIIFQKAKPPSNLLNMLFITGMVYAVIKYY